MKISVENRLRPFPSPHVLSTISTCYWILVLLTSKGVFTVNHLPDRSFYLMSPFFTGLFPLGAIITAFHFKALLQFNTDRRPILISGSLSGITLFALFVFFWWPVAASLLLFFGPPAVLAVGCNRILTRPLRLSSRPLWREWLYIFVLFTGVYWWMGLYFTHSVGQHSGDEGHYLLQAESLYFDGDLDLRNNFGQPLPDQAYVHISPNARGDHWYSWHSPGLSFLMAPTVGLGLWWRHGLLALIAGSAIAGLYVLSIIWGSPRRSALVVMVLLAWGPYWGIYASRALPEVLGACLVTYGMIAVFTQERYPAWSIALAVVCIGYLPWAQARFIPVAVTLMGCFGLRGLLLNIPWKTKGLRLGIFGVLCLASFAFFWTVKTRMFENGLAYPVEGLLFSQPSGLWHSLASQRGVLYVFPVFACGLAAAMSMLVQKRYTLAGAFALLMFLSVWLTACSTRWFTGGACVPGRFLLVISPLLIAGLATQLCSTRASFTLLTCYLGLVPVGLMILQLSTLSRFGKGFTHPMGIDSVHPFFIRLPEFFYDPYQTVQVMPAAALYLAAFFLVFPGWKLSRLVQYSLLVFAVVAFIATSKMDFGPRLSTPQTAYRFLHQHGVKHLFAVARGTPTRGKALLTDAFNRFDVRGSDIKSFTSEDLGTLLRDDWISEPHLPVNDWKNRGYRWATLVPPFRAGAEWNALTLQAGIPGESDVEFVIREGEYVRVVQTFFAGTTVNETMVFETKNSGDLYILVRFKSRNGRLQVKRLACSPYTEALLQTGGLSIQPATE